jgi:DNA-binding LacI/PurR family transcriptional regulator
MATIKQVAQRAGVSSATVSRVLSGSAAVTPAYAERVLAAVAELNYRPNLLASNLRRKKTAKIGVVVPDIENPHFSQSIRIFEEVAYREGFRILLCNTEDQPEKQREYLHVLADEQVEGILLVPIHSDGSEIAGNIDRGIPLLAYDRPVDDPRADAVIADNFEGARRATEVLIDAGHQRIGFVGGIAALKPGADRQAGYETALRAHGLAPHVANGEFNIERARAATTALLRGPDGITGLVVGSNLMTIGAQRAIRALGVRVPADLALVGIDDPWWTELLEPPMTTVAQPVRRMAETAVNLLFERISGARTQPRCVVFGFELRIRESCGTRNNR